MSKEDFIAVFEVVADYGFIFLLKIGKEVQDLCVIFKENQLGSIAPNVRVVLIFQQCVFLWYRFKVMYQQSVTLIFVWNTALVIVSAKKSGERWCRNETVKL